MAKFEAFLMLTAFTAGLTLITISELGDKTFFMGRSTQIATITLAAASHALGVALGAIVGHGICAAIAVLGGGLMAGRISEQTLTLGGGALFLIFAIVTARHARTVLRHSKSRIYRRQPEAANSCTAARIKSARERTPASSSSTFGRLLWIFSRMNWR